MINKDDSPLSDIFNNLTTISTVVNEGKGKLNKEEKNAINNSVDKVKSKILDLTKELFLLKGKVEAYSETAKAQAGLSEKLDMLLKRPSPTAQTGSTGNITQMAPPRKSYASITGSAPSSGSKTIFVGGQERETPILKLMVIFYPNVPEGKTLKKFCIPS